MNPGKIKIVSQKPSFESLHKHIESLFENRSACARVAIHVMLKKAMKKKRKAI